MEESFVTFRKFNVESQAVELGNLLDKHKIEYEFEDGSPTLDASFGNTELSKEFAIKLKKADFAIADKILLEESVDDINSIDKDYYLFSFSDSELMDVVVKRDEWNAFDFLLAQKLLTERGHEITEEKLEILRNQRLTDLAKPEENQTAWIIAGYIFALLGGLLGIFIGWFLSNHKKTLPNGERVYNYSAANRSQGRIIMALSLAVIIIMLLYKFTIGFLQNYSG